LDKGEGLKKSNFYKREAKVLSLVQRTLTEERMSEGFAV
jgi:hypothetical protein